MPRPGLPRGLLLFTVYAPLQVRAQSAAREQFVALMQQVVHALDMQIPTLVMGDFNGSVAPQDDFMSESGSRRPPCPLLQHLLGPASPWVDVHRALLGEVPWTFQNVDSTGKLSASRIDLVLANHLAMALVQGASVLQSVRDGGHSPVLVQLRVGDPLVLDWQRPSPRLPLMLCQSSGDLGRSVDWLAVLDRWLRDPVVSGALDAMVTHTAATLSAALVAALQHLVAIAGGWVFRPRVRRLAYDSQALRVARRLLVDLNDLARLLRQLVSSPPGCWPRPVGQLLGRLAGAGLHFPQVSAAVMVPLVEHAAAEQRAVIHRITRELRRARHDRWANSLASLWQDRPGVVYHWLHAAGAPWGSLPVLDESGMQCTSVAAVDAAVRGYWVDQVLRRHAAEDGAVRWAAFQSSEFGNHIPTLSWPAPCWTAERVQLVLRRMREAAAPGSLGIPVAVWKALPEPWHAAVARLLNLIEAEGVWPSEWLVAYVSMIPKSAGGSRPRDQRPITVLDLLYRIWSKGVVLTWAPVLQQSYLGQAALGFRAGAGTLHAAQLLQDLIHLQKQRRLQLWLASFDVEKCYDSLPWWAVFGVLRRAGVEERVVRCFEAFYRSLRRHFRYGQVDGECWQAANGLAQGCPAAPDLLNVLLEAFHRWATAAGHGVEVAPGCKVASISFADDVALIAQDQLALETLITAYLRWCTLLGVKVTKVQVWTNLPGRWVVEAAGLQAATSPTFKMVGVVLGANEQLATKAHLAPRLEKALVTARRLKMLDLPAAVCSLLWHTAVLPQAVYGCEVRDLRPTALATLTSAGQAAVSGKSPLLLNGWRSSDALMGPPFGSSAVRAPMLEVRERQLRWLHVLANLPTVVGLVHRVVAGSGPAWLEPPGALASALADVGWSLHRNHTCLRAQRWPELAPEECYLGSVVLQPVDAFPLLEAVYTDGSVMTLGGAAAVCPDTGTVACCKLPRPRSSTHCELVALGLGLQLGTSHILTDSLAALHTVKGWGCWPVERMLRCADRREVRWVLSLAASRPPALLEKVLAHDSAALAMQHPKAVGNDLADAAARRAASSSGVPVFAEDLSTFGDPVEMLDGFGSLVSDVRGTLADVWWARRHSGRRRPRPFLDLLYPAGVPFLWMPSTALFRRPVVVKRQFVHPVPVPVVKWLARVRSGCLNSRLRLFSHHLETSPACPCCGAEEEDEEHVVAGCPATGSADWLRGLLEVWDSAARSAEVTVPLPPISLLEQFHLPLLAALLPVPLVDSISLPAGQLAPFLRRLHVGLAQQTAEWLRRRGATIATAILPSPPPAAPSLSAPFCHLPLERQLLPADLRRLEVERRSAPPPAPSPAASASAVPPRGAPRQRWLRHRLVQLLQDATESCAEGAAVPSVTVLALFESVTGEPFTDTPGTKLASRVAGLARVMGNLTRDVVFDPPLRHYSRGGRAFWGRRVLQPLDVDVWRAGVEAAELAAVPAARSRRQMEEANDELLDWFRQHRYLGRSTVEEGESSVALLMLWEVDHGRPFPTHGGGGPSTVLASFTRRLRARVVQDATVCVWATCRISQRPLLPGLPASFHTWWSVKVLEPPAGEPRGWYEEFVRRWRAYAESVANSVLAPAVGDGSSSSSSVPPAPSSSVSAVHDPVALPVSPLASTAPVPVVSPVVSLRHPGVARHRVCRPRPMPHASAPAVPVDGRPPKRRRPPAGPPAGAAPSSTVDVVAPATVASTLPLLPAAPAPVVSLSQQSLGQQRPRDPTALPPSKRRQGDLRQWLRPAVAPDDSAVSASPDARRQSPKAGHGRAMEGPPT